MSVKVDNSVEDSEVIPTPGKPLHTLDQLLKEQVQLEREMGRRVSDQEFLNDKPAGREIL
ncbi:MAG: hypothetical protein WB870_05030 [Gallionellaceae bacterium]